MITNDARERGEIVSDAIERCRQVLEDGWEDENYRYIESGITKILHNLQEKVGIPSGHDIDRTISAIKEKYGPGQMHMESAIGCLMHVEREWLGKLGAIEKTSAPKKKWEDMFGAR